jgi:HSP20 family protein
MKLVKYHKPYNMFDELFGDLSRGFFPASACGVDSTEKAPGLRLPRTNIEENDDGYTLTMEMPGLAKKDVEVSVEKDTLTVKGEKSEKTEEKDGWLRREIRSSSFERSFSLGSEVGAENIKAKMSDGILVITLPKVAEKVGRKVDVD